MLSTLAMFCQNQPLLRKEIHTIQHWILDQIHFGNLTARVGNTEVGGDGEIGVLI